VADDHGVSFAQCRNQPDDVADEMKLRVRVDLVRCVGLPVAALIGRNDVIAGITQRLQLVAPRIPGLRKTMTQHNERTVRRAGVRDMHVDAVGCDRAMLDLGHCGPLMRASCAYNAAFPPFETSLACHG